MESLAPRIFHIPPTRDPLSADAFILAGDARYYVFDVGHSDDAYAAIAALDKPVTVILSHFHADHTGNIHRLSPAEILVGARTRKYIGAGTLVDAPLTIEDGITLTVQPCVSPHAPGSLILTMDDTYTFLGDAPYGARPGAGPGEATGMLRVLQRLRTQYFIPSHRPDRLFREKDEFLREIGAYFQQSHV